MSEFPIFIISSLKADPSLFQVARPKHQQKAHSIPGQKSKRVEFRATKDTEEKAEGGKIKILCINFAKSLADN